MARDKSIPKAFTASVSGQGHSIMADDWPGVVAAGEGWRVIVPRNASKYRLQRLSPHKGKRWEPVHGIPSSHLEWGAALARSCPDLAAAVDRLPVDPQDAVAVLVAAQGVVLPQVQRRSYWNSPDYSGVLASDANIRAVRDRTGNVYALQWIRPADFEAGNSVAWQTLRTASCWPELVEGMAHKIVVVGDAPQDRDAIRLRLLSLFDGLPELAADGPWPVSKVRPIFEREQRVKR